MQNAGIYHIAVCSQPNSLTSSVPRGSAPRPRWGLCPQTPTFSRYALVFLSPDFPTNKNFRCWTQRNLLTICVLKPLR